MMNPIRRRLMAVARRYALPLRRRPGVAGLVVYGSLAGDPAELTSFSDVDIAVILDRRMPAHFTEHRLAGSIKADLLLFSIRRLRRIAGRSPKQLAASTWTENLLVKGLLQGGPDTILHDPRGEIARAKQRLAARTSWRATARLQARGSLQVARREIAGARRHLAAGRWQRAHGIVQYVLWLVTDAMLQAAGTKRIPVAARRRGAPEFGRLVLRLRALLTNGHAAVAASLRADDALWAWIRREVDRPLLVRLRRAGVRSPAKLEFHGSYRGFWSGNRVHEFGRLLAEPVLSLKWARHRLRRGDLYGALEVLAYFCAPWRQRLRLLSLATALERRGFRVRPLIRQAMRSPAYRRLAAVAGQAEGDAWARGDRPAAARAAVRLAGRLMRVSS